MIIHIIQATQDNLEKRIAEHQSGEIKEYTSKLRPVVLVFSQEFPTRVEAITAELQIKGWSRKKKEALINAKNPGWNDLWEEIKSW